METIDFNSPRSILQQYMTRFQVEVFVHKFWEHVGLILVSPINYELAKRV